MKRHWGRLVWVGFTNLPICIFFIIELINMRQEEIRAFATYPPTPSLWSLLSDNYHLVFVVLFAGGGFLLEVLNWRVAAFVNCGFWLVVLVYEIVQKAGGGPAIIFVSILAVDFLWYVMAARREAAP